MKKKKDYCWNTSTCICRNGKYLKGIFDEVVNVMDNVSIVSINSINKNVRYKVDCNTFQAVLLVIILPFIIAIICYHYSKHRSKQKHINTIIIWKSRIMNKKS